MRKFWRPRGRRLSPDHQVGPASLPQPLEIVLARHPAVHDPDPLGEAVARLHRVDDLLDGRHVRAIPRDELIAQRLPPACDDQR